MSPRTNRRTAAVASRGVWLLVLLMALAGCASSKLRFTRTPRLVPLRQLEISQANNDVGVIQPPQQAVTTPTTGSVQTVAYQPHAAEDIPPPASSDKSAGAKVDANNSTSTATAAEFPLDMSTALALVAGKNPQVGFARARIQEAYASRQAANVMWLPTIQSGVSWNHHEGTLQDSSGVILDVSRTALEAGLGAGAVGSSTTPQPGLVAQFHFADAIFQPRIAERTLWAQEHARNAVLNNQLLEAAVAYQELLRAYQLQAIAKETATNSEQLVRLTSDFARVGQGTQADADRSEAEMSLRRNNVARADEAVAVASARLAQVLSLGGGPTIRPVETTVTPIELVHDDMAPQESVAVALGTRPELKESRDLVDAACERLRREKYAPLVPSVLLGASYAGFGGGMGDTIADFRDRADFDAVAVWQVRNLGFGEEAARDAACARLQQAHFRELQVMDQVARDVTEASAKVQARRHRIEVARAGIESAHSSLDRNLGRIRGGQGLPIEVLQAIQSLDATERDLVEATVDYNTAQFQLQWALGWPIQKLPAAQTDCH
jgi:outer membrane protein TolC